MHRYLLLMVFSSVVSTAVHANVLSWSCEANLRLGPLESALGTRGYLGTSDDITDAQWKKLRARGVLAWSMRLFVVKNEDDAIRQSQVSARLPHLAPFARSAPQWSDAWRSLRGADLLRSALEFTYLTLGDRGSNKRSFNPLMAGLYVIDPKADLHEMSSEELAVFKTSLRRKPIWEIDEDGRMTQLDPEVVELRLDPSQMVLDRELEFEPQHLVQHGFFFPRRRTLVDLERLPVTPSGGSQSRRYRFRIIPHHEGLTLEVFDAHARGPGDIALSISGTVQNGIYVLDSRYAPRPLPTYVRYPFVSLRDDLLAMGISVVDTTKVWELQNHPRSRVITAEDFGRLLATDRSSAPKR